MTKLFKILNEIIFKILSIALYVVLVFNSNKTHPFKKKIILKNPLSMFAFMEMIKKGRHGTKVNVNYDKKNDHKF